MGFGVYMFVTNPLMVNPFHVLEQLEADAIPYSTLVVMAGMMPLLFLLALLILTALIVFVFAAIANERRYHAIIRKLGGAGHAD